DPVVGFDGVDQDARVTAKAVRHVRPRPRFQQVKGRRSRQRIGDAIGADGAIMEAQHANDQRVDGVGEEWRVRVNARRYDFVLQPAPARSRVAKVTTFAQAFDLVPGQYIRQRHAEVRHRLAVRLEIVWHAVSLPGRARAGVNWNGDAG